MTTARHIFNKTYRITSSAVDLFKQIKPYHTKLFEVVEQYTFNEDVTVRVSDTSQITITYAPRPDCMEDGWGLDYDSIFCGYDPVGCCEPFNCEGGYGIVWDDNNLYNLRTVTSVNEDQIQIVVAGDLTRDVLIPIHKTESANTISVNTTDINLFTGDGTTTVQHSVFEIVGDRRLRIVSADPIDNVLVVEHNRLQDLLPSTGGVIQSPNYNQFVQIVESDVIDPDTISVKLDSSVPVDANWAGQVLQITVPYANAGLYGLSSALSPAHVIDGRVHLELNRPLEDLTTVGVGSIMLRTAVVHPRIVTIKADPDIEEQATVLSSRYDPSTNQTLITLSHPLLDVMPDSTGVILELRGTDSGQGFDGFPTCVANTDTLVYPRISEALHIEYIDTEPPPAFSTVSSSHRFGAIPTRTAVTVTPVTIERVAVPETHSFGVSVANTSIAVTEQFKPVFLISITPDITELCNNYFELEAVILGDLTGHVVSWEQIDNSAEIITFSGQGTTNVAYTGNASHKIRCWVDKGTEYEQYLDVYVDTTPSGRINPAGMKMSAVGGVSHSWTYSSNNVAPEPDTFVGITEMAVEEPCATNRGIWWETPPNVVSQQIQRWNGTSWVGVDDVAVEYPRSTGNVGPAVGVFRVRFEIDDPTHANSRYWYSEHLLTGDVEQLGLITDVVKERPRPAGASVENATFTYELDQVTRLQLAVDDEIYSTGPRVAAIKGADLNNTTYDLHLRTLDTIPPEIGQDVVPVHSIGGSADNTTFTYTLIGSAVIGG